jgi:hypothetical protein
MEAEMRRVVLPTLIAAIVLPVTLTGQLTTPTDWKWRQDAPAPLAPGSKMEPGSWVFVQMPPGWHVTTGPGVLLYPASNGEASGNFSLEAEIFLFPDAGDGEYGIFLGGRNVDGSASPDYVAFVLRKDGRAAVARHRADQTVPLPNWQPHGAIVAQKGGADADAVKNVIRVDVDQINATMSVNGAKVLVLPRTDIQTDGRIGFRIGTGVNLHISTFNVTRKLAPVPVKKASGPG